MNERTDRRIGPNLKKLPDKSGVRIDNVTCVYCGIELNKQSSTKEHLIGRRFVPRGKLQGNWNLIFNACESCNRAKSDLEGDVSAITLQPDAFGRYGHNDKAAKSDGYRKAKNAYSRRTNKLVKDSVEEIGIKMPLSDVGSISFNFTSQPQVDQDRVFQLARFQIVGFFYWITLNRTSMRGRFWRGGFFPVLEAGRSDWGNPVHSAFADAVVRWEPRVLAITADGFYKVAIRRHPNADCWSWALEWNHSLRVIGFCGERQATDEIVSGLPKLQMQVMQHSVNRTISVRTDNPLDEHDNDKLFYSEI